MKTRGKEADEQLLVEAAQEDPRRFVELYEANFDRVYAFIAARVRNRAEAEDFTSEVFHKALANLSRFEWRGAPFASWLFRIAANAMADRSARLAREGEVRLPNHPPEQVQPVGLEEAEQRARLYRLVRRLPRDQRRVIVMRFAEQKSIREIAEEMRRTDGSVKQLQIRALENLRTRMASKSGGAHG
ncbi:MAG TPA: sigma-70 family RNA polymerase sigma factor [Terriglobia bacterium]